MRSKYKHLVRNRFKTSLQNAVAYHVTSQPCPFHFLTSCPFPCINRFSGRQLNSRDAARANTVIHPESCTGQVYNRHNRKSRLIEAQHYTPGKRNPHHAIWGHLAPRLAENHRSEYHDDESDSSPRHREDHMEEIISFSRWHHQRTPSYTAGSSIVLSVQIGFWCNLGLIQICQR